MLFRLSVAAGPRASPKHVAAKASSPGTSFSWHIKSAITLVFVFFWGGGEINLMVL